MITDKAVYTPLFSFGDLKGIRKTRKQKALDKIITDIESMINPETFENRKDTIINYEGMRLVVSVQWYHIVTLDNGEQVKEWRQKPHVWICHSGHISELLDYVMAV